MSDSRECALCQQSFTPVGREFICSACKEARRERFARQSAFDGAWGATSRAIREMIELGQKYPDAAPLVQTPLDALRAALPSLTTIRNQFHDQNRVEDELLSRVR